MNPRMLVCTMAAVSASACRWPEPTFEEVDLGVDVRLNAVEVIGFDEGFIAVGSGGVIVRDDGHTWDLVDIELHDIQIDPEYALEGPWSWFVVGDAGTIVVGRQPSSDADIEWLVQESGTNASLHAVTVVDGTTPLVVGNEVVLIGQPTAEPGMFEWIAEPAPPGGWGRLRDVEGTLDDDGWLRAAGLQGRIWLVDSQLDVWLSIDAGTNEDLFDVYPGGICGARGTIVTCGDWHGEDVHDCTSDRLGEFDFVACHHNGRLGTDRSIHVSWDESPYQLDWQPRAIDEVGGQVVVGDRGRAGWWTSNEPLGL